MQQVAVYVISLARATERRRAIAAHLDSIGIEYEIVDAVDGRALSDEYRASVVAPGCVLTPGLIGCGLSHWELSKKHLASDREVALFLEDDARLSPAAAAFLKSGVDASAFDFCFLDCTDYNNYGPIFYDRDDSFELSGGFRAHRLSGGPLKTHALMVTKAATAKRIVHMVPIRHPIDIYAGLPYTPRFFAIVSPKAAWLSEYSFESSTSPSGSSGDVPPKRFAAFRQSQFYYQLREWLKLKRPRRMMIAWLLKTEGFVDPKKRWVPLGSAAQVLR